MEEKTLEVLNLSCESALNAIEMKSEKGFFIGCLDSVVDYSTESTVFKRIMEKEEDSKLFKVKSDSKEFLVLDEIPNYEVQCSGYLKGYFIPTGSSFMSVVPFESCNKYLLLADSSEGILIKGKSLVCTEKDGTLKLVCDEKKKLTLVSNGDSIPKYRTRVKSKDEDLDILD